MRRLLKQEAVVIHTHRTVGLQLVALVNKDRVMRVESYLRSLKVVLLISSDA